MDGINEINGRYDALIDDINEIDRFIYGVFEKHGRYIPNDIWHLVTEKLLERRKKNSILIELRMLLAAIKEQKGAGNKPDPENSGVAYCEHYPKGLPVCSRCREESTLAHDKACAELAEARAEIAELKKGAESDTKTILRQANSIRTTGEELADKVKQLSEARAEIKMKNEELDMFLAEQQAMGEIIERKDKLIEQMREALRLALPEARSTHCEQTILAALAAERGE